LRGVAPAIELGRFLQHFATGDPRPEEGVGAARSAVFAGRPRQWCEVERQTAAALPPSAAQFPAGLLDELPPGRILALGRLLDPAALPVFFGDRDRIEARKVVICTARRTAVGIDAQPDRIRADAAFPNAGPFGPFLRRGRRGEK